MKKSPQSLGYLAVSLICLIVAISQTIAPYPTRPSGGRWDWLSGLLWDFSGGNIGIQIYWIALSMLFGAIYLIKDDK